MTARTAVELGLANSLFPADDLAGRVREIALKLAQAPTRALALTKRAVNQCEDQMGMRNGMDSVFGLHHFAHAHNAEVGTDSLGGMNAKSMAASARPAPASNAGPTAQDGAK